MPKSAGSDGASTKTATKAASGKSESSTTKPSDGITNGAMPNGANGGPSKKQQTQKAVSDLDALVILCNKLVRNKDLYADMETALAQKDKRIASLSDEVSALKDEKSRLELELRVKEDEVRKSNQCREQAVLDFEKRTLEMGAEKRSLEDQVRSVRQEAKSDADRQIAAQSRKHENELTALRKRVSGAEARTGSLEAQVKNSERLLEKAKAEKAFAEQRSKEWEDVLRGLEELDLETFEADFQNEVTNLLNVAKHHFIADLPQDAFDNATTWKNLHKTASFHTTTPLPIHFAPKNTPAAKAARHLAALTVLSETLTSLLLTPSYVPYPSAFYGWRVLTELLNEQYAVDPAWEQMTRALLVATYDRVAVEGAAQDAAHRAAQDAATRLGPLLGGGEKASNFCTAIEAVFLGFARLWIRAQRSRKRILASIFEAHGEWEWNEMPEFGGRVEQPGVGAGPQQFRMVNVVPRVWWQDGDGGWGSLCPGAMVDGDQELVLAAEGEYRAWREDLDRRAVAASAQPLTLRGQQPFHARSASTRQKRGNSILGSGSGSMVSSYSSVSRTSPQTAQRNSFLDSVDPVLPGGFVQEPQTMMADSGGRGGGL